MRKMASVALRDLGVGKRSLEERIQNEINAITQKLQSLNSSPFDPKHLLETSVTNIICSIVFGER